jgi:LysM repeat protein
VGSTTTIEIRVDNVSGLAAADVELRFNPSVLQVQDADPNREGIQIQPGNFPAPDFVAVNTADNAAGIIRYALTQLPPHAPVNGSGVMASVVFRGVNAGQADVVFNVVNLANAQGQPIPSTAQGGTIMVGTGPPPTPPVWPTPTLLPPVWPTPTPGPYPPGPTVTPPAPPGPCPVRYVVRPGDTLSAISRRYGVSIWQIASYNNIQNINLIYVGQGLIIPCGPGPGPVPPVPGPCPTRYVVQWGDTLYSIARRHGFTVWELASYNSISNPNYIYAGQVILIPCPTPGPYLGQ